MQKGLSRGVFFPRLFSKGFSRRAVFPRLFSKGFSRRAVFPRLFSKGFFSVVILVIAVLLLLFFVEISANTKPLIFSDLPRYSVLVSEEAYSLLDVQLSLTYIMYEQKGTVCQTTQDDTNGFVNHLNGKDLLDPWVICNSNIKDVDVLFKSDTNSLDANITAEIICNTKNDIESYTYSKTFTFHKNYKSVKKGSICNYTLKDLDADFIYYQN